MNEVSPGLVDSARHPKTCAWSERLLALDIVPRSAVPELGTLYRGMMKNRGGHLATLMSS